MGMCFVSTDVRSHVVLGMGMMVEAVRLVGMAAGVRERSNFVLLLLFVTELHKNQQQNPFIHFRHYVVLTHTYMGSITLAEHTCHKYTCSICNQTR